MSRGGPGHTPSSEELRQREGKGESKREGRGIETAGRTEADKEKGEAEEKRGGTGPEELWRMNSG